MFRSFGAYLSRESRPAFNPYVYMKSSNSSSSSNTPALAAEEVLTMSLSTRTLDFLAPRMIRTEGGKATFGFALERSFGGTLLFVGGGR